jgi:hypothetical protein
MPRSSLDKGSSKDRPHLGGGYIYRQTTVVREEADWRLFLTAFHYPHPDQRSTFPATKAAAVGDGGDGGGAPLLLSRSGAPNPFDSIVRLQARIGQYLTCDARGRWLETRKVWGANMYHERDEDEKFIQLGRWTRNCGWTKISQGFFFK